MERDVKERGLETMAAIKAWACCQRFNSERENTGQRNFRANQLGRINTNFKMAPLPFSREEKNFTINISTK